MIRAVILDSTPLALLVHRHGFPPADECRTWAQGQLESGRRLYVPAIIAYELRRELLRLKKVQALALLDDFTQADPDRYIPLTDAHLRHAAELWAACRQQGRPGADPHALDVDVILAAQALSLGIRPTEFIVATSDVGHLAAIVPAQEWRSITPARQ